MPIVTKALRFLGSFQLSVAVFALLTLITWLGTVSQETLGLYQSQKLYFESWFATRELGGWSIPFLPGGLLLMVVLFVNLTIGGIVLFVPRVIARSRGRSATTRVLSGAGIAITHLGILVLLLSGLAKYLLAEEGAVRLHEGESATGFVSYHDWEVAIEEVDEDGRVREFIIPHAQFADRSLDRTVTARASDLPFRLVLRGFTPNAQLRRAPRSTDAPAPVVDGFWLQPTAPSKEWQRNVAGCYARAESADGQPIADAILWGLEPAPMIVAVGERRFGVTLRKQRTPLPFGLRLDRFELAYHPGTRVPREFLSMVTVLAADGPQAHKIRMNEPLRRDGLIVFQASWGPTDAPPDTPRFSEFSVVRNPADPWPWYSLYVIAAGLVVHFTTQLARFLAEQARSAPRRQA